MKYNKIKMLVAIAMVVILFNLNVVVAKDLEEKVFRVSVNEDTIVEITVKIISEKDEKETNKQIVNASIVKNNPTEYYGNEVIGYTCKARGVDKWRIFYSDGTNIYLIADDYIRNVFFPVIKSKDYYVGDLSQVLKIESYSGANWIRKNSPASKWLKKYWDYSEDIGITYPNKDNTYRNIKETAYLLDTSDSAWGNFANKAYADYAIGGVPLEMYCKSYNDTHINSTLECVVDEVTYGHYSSAYGYGYWLSDSFYRKSGNILSDYNEIYIKPYKDKAYGTWIASPSCGAEYMPVACWNGCIDECARYKAGFRPLVCLKSDIELLVLEDELLEIIE